MNESDKLRQTAEIAKLEAETAKLEAEAMRLDAETVKLRRRRNRSDWCGGNAPLTQGAW